MVPSRPKSKVYNCFIKLSGILHEIDFNNKETSMAWSGASKNWREMRCVYCDVIRKCTANSSVWAKHWRENLRFCCDITETPNRPSLSICGVLTLRYCRGKHVSANHERAKLAKIPDHLIKFHIHLSQSPYLYNITDYTAEKTPTLERYMWCHRRTASSKPIKILPSAMSEINLWHSHI